MNKFNNNAAIFFLDMCTKQVEHYTRVIDSCETMEQLNTATDWILDGFKSLRSVAENLPRRRRKLCLSAFEAVKLHVFNVNLSKCLDLLGKKIDKMIFDRQPKFEQASEKTLEDLLEALKNSSAKGVIVKVERVQKTDPEAPGDGQSADKEDPEGSR